MRIGITPVAAGLAIASPAFAQSFNVDFGSGNAPGAAYAAVGASGAWNLVGVLPPAQRQSLISLQGGPSNARIYMIGGTALLESDDPLTTGDDESLLDDMLIGFNDPVDVCVWVEGLTNGTYGVVLYAMTPNEAARTCRTRVDDSPQPPTEVGGAWPGQHEELVTYSTFSVGVTNGTIGLHSGLWGANFQSGLNGLQLVDLSGTSAPLDVPEGASLRTYPNPSRAAQRLEWRGAGPLEIVDVSGRVVWSTPGVATTEGRITRWDGTDRAGRRVPAGVYFARVGGSERTEAIKLIRLD